VFNGKLHVFWRGAGLGAFIELDAKRSAEATSGLEVAGRAVRCDDAPSGVIDREGASLVGVRTRHRRAKPTGHLKAACHIGGWVFWRSGGLGRCTWRDVCVCRRREQVHDPSLPRAAELG